MEGIKNLLAHKQDKIVKQTPVECFANLDGELDKVLAINANAQTNSAEFFEKECKFGGDVMISVTYRTEDDQINTVTTNCNFADTIKNDALTVGTKGFAKTELVGVNPVVAENNGIKIIVTVETSLDIAENVELDSFEYDDDVCIKNDEIDINTFCGMNCVDFTVETTAPAGENIKKVLLLDSNALVTNITSGDGFVSVSGIVCTQIVALTHENKFKPFQLCQDFKEEAMLENAKPDMTVNAFVKIKNDGVKVVLEEADNQMNLIVTTPAKLCVRGFVTNKMDTVEDIYSTKSELEVTKQKYQSVGFYPPKYFESKIEGNLSLGEEDPRIDKVLASSCPTLMITNSYFEDGQIVVEGIVNTNVIYLNDDENKINSVEMEIPFKVSEKTDIETDNVKVDCNAILTDCDCMAKRGREVYYDCKIKVYAELSYDTEVEVVTKINETRTLPQNDSAIEIYFAKTGDTVWDIAKELKVTEEQLLNQNPDLVSPLEKDEKVVLYYNLN